MALEDEPIEHRQTAYDAITVKVFEVAHANPPVARVRSQQCGAGIDGRHRAISLLTAFDRAASSPAGCGRPLGAISLSQPRGFGCGRRLR
jgi:hypothetical protein